MFLTFDTQQKIVLAHNKDNIYKKYMSEASLEIMFKLNCRTFKVFLNIFPRLYFMSIIKFSEQLRTLIYISPFSFSQNMKKIILRNNAKYSDCFLVHKLTFPLYYKRGRKQNELKLKAENKGNLITDRRITGG